MDATRFFFLASLPFFLLHVTGFSRDVIDGVYDSWLLITMSYLQSCKAYLILGTVVM